MPYDPTEITTADRIGPVMSGLARAFIPFASKFLGDEPRVQYERDAQYKMQQAKLEQESLGNQLKGLSAQEATLGMQKARGDVARSTVDQYLAEGKNPLDFLPEQMLRDSGSAISVGAQLLDTSGNVIHQDRKVLQIKDKYGDQINRLDPEFKPAFMTLLDKSVNDESTKEVGRAFQWAAGQREQSLRRLMTPTKTLDPNTQANQIKGRMIQLETAIANLDPSGPNADQNRETLVNSRNALIPQLYQLRAAGGATQEELDQINQPITMSQAKSPEETSNFSKWFHSKLPWNQPDAAPPNSANITNNRQVKTPPAVTGTDPMKQKQSKAMMLPTRSGESANGYIKRLKESKLFTTNEIADAFQQKFPGLVSK